QYFGVKAAQEHVRKKEGGIIWHTQGSGKSLTMIWLAKWIRENITDARVLIITDRDDLDSHIKDVFLGVNKNIYRCKSGKNLIENLNQSTPALLCSLIHKFGSREGENDQDIEQFINEIKKNLPSNFKAKGDIFVFVDECHRTQSGKLHQAMMELLPKATFIGFTGTPLLSVDKHNSIATFGNFIHTYKYDEAVKDKVVLDLRYEARRVDQDITSQTKIDVWFDERTKGLTDVAKAELKKRWGTMQTLLSSGSRLERVVFDILDDYYTKPRLASGRGNALLVASSIYEACQYYEIFQNKGFTKCAVVTSYDTGALNTEDREYAIYQKMLDNYKKTYGVITKRNDETESEAFERNVKELFVKQPAKMQLLIVVDKLLTGFDAPPATYLYIDKNMQDHGLFQAICRVNRLHGEDKEYGYIVDYRDLFKKLEKTVNDYTSEAFAGYDKEDVLGLLKDKVGQGKEDLEEALEEVRALCEPVTPPKASGDYIKYFCGDIENPYSLKENEFKRVKLYRSTSHLVRVFAEIANDLSQAGFDSAKANSIRLEVEHYSQVKTEIKLASGDYIDLKKYEPDMRMLIDRYITARESEKISAFDDLSLVEMLATKGPEAVDSLPDNLKKDKNAVAETIENNVRRLIIDEMPTNPKYFQNMSEILDQLVRDRRQEALEYQEYLKRVTELTKKVKDPGKDNHYSPDLNTRAKQALYDNLNRDENLALQVDHGMKNRPDDWIGNKIKERMVRINLKQILSSLSDEEFNRVFTLIKEQNEYR
ncbi:MAG TPA: type I restriction endonuclease subunit R, partial [Candidatus Wunengus sp. YC60]|uniref:type I restriction endonuclease subunit R n=1 Tax=Candidatus Wunengus sp. YC60 TaxID=3367697 RepID=UPI0040288ECB